MKDTSRYIAGIREHLDGRFPYYMEILEQMVGINSFTRNASGVNRLGEMIASLFAEKGFHAETAASADPVCGDHLICTRGDRDGIVVGCVSHLDTVFAPEEEIAKCFAWKPEGNRVYGPGTIDVKGGTLLLYMMIDAMAAIIPEIFERARWVLLFDATEEDESDDFGALCRERLGALCRACLVFEAGHEREDSHSIVTARKGRAVFRIACTGRGAHAGSDHAAGANAISQMAAILPMIDKINDYARDLTVNVGLVQGGTVINRVPERCEAGVEMRAFDPQVLESGVERVMKLDGFSSIKSADRAYRCFTKVELLRRNPSWPRNAKTDRLAGYWHDAAKKLGFRLIDEQRGGISDGNLLWAEIPVIDGLGPSGANAHCSEKTADGAKDQEYAIISSFIPKTLLNTEAVIRLIEEEMWTSDAGR